VFYPLGSCSLQKHSTNPLIDVEGGESAENGPADARKDAPATEGEADASTVELPEVPTSEPSDDGPAAKKQKQNSEEKS